jgi:hypothetical protein
MSVGIITKVDALFSLCPGAKWTLRGEELEWVDTIQTKPTEEELQAEIIRLQTQYDANEYQRKRANEYPPIGDQLDALWKGGDAAAEMLAKVQAVKTKYPKSN